MPSARSAAPSIAVMANRRTSRFGEHSRAASPRPGWIRGQSRPRNRPPIRDLRDIKGAPQVFRDILRAPERHRHHVAELNLLEPSDDPAAQPGPVARRRLLPEEAREHRPHLAGRHPFDPPDHGAEGGIVDLDRRQSSRSHASAPGKTKSPYLLLLPLGELCQVRRPMNTRDGARNRVKENREHSRAAPRGGPMRSTSRTHSPMRRCRCESVIERADASLRVPMRVSGARPVKKRVGLFGPTRFGNSPDWTRTSNLAVNSRPLYRLSYRGMLGRAGDSIESPA